MIHILDFRREHVPFLTAPVNFGRMYCGRCDSRQLFVAWEPTHRELKHAECSNCGWCPGESVDVTTDPITGRTTTVRTPVLSTEAAERAAQELAEEIERYLVSIGLPKHEAKIHAGTTESSIGR